MLHPRACLVGQMLHLRVIHAHEHVLGLEVRVDYFTFRVQIMKTFENLKKQEKVLINKYNMLFGVLFNVTSYLSRDYSHILERYASIVRFGD